MAARIALCVSAIALFLGLFCTQLEDERGPIKKSYAFMSSATTPCSEDKSLCVPLFSVYDPLGEHYKRQLAYTEDWRGYYTKWAGLLGDDKQCNCSKAVAYSRYYAFHTDFPCGNHVKVCKPPASASSLEFALAAVRSQESCFPLPVPDMPQASSILAELGAKLNTLQNLNFTSATRDMVETAGNHFCRLLRNMPVIETPALFPVSLLSGQLLHLSAVRALSSSLNVLTTAALTAATLHSNASDAESAYMRQYLNWHSSRVIAQAHSEVQVTDEVRKLHYHPWGSQAHVVLTKPLLLPLRVQTALSRNCSTVKGSCDMTGFLRDKAYAGDDAYAVWHFDAFDYASYTCQPTLCTTLLRGRWYDKLTNVLALLGGLSHAIILVGLPAAWAVLCWSIFSGVLVRGWAWVCSELVKYGYTGTPTTTKGQVAPDPPAGSPGSVALITQVRGPVHCGFRQCGYDKHDPVRSCNAALTVLFM